MATTLLRSANLDEPIRRKRRNPISYLRKSQHTPSGGLLPPLGLIPLPKDTLLPVRMQPAPLRPRRHQKFGGRQAGMQTSHATSSQDSILITNSQLSRIWNSSLTSSQVNDILGILPVEPMGSASIARQGSDVPLPSSRPQSVALTYPTKVSANQGGPLLPGEVPARHRTDAEIISERVKKSKKIRITANAAAFEILNRYIDFRCVAFRLKHKSADSEKWIWYEIIDAPRLAFEAISGVDTGTAKHAFRTGVFASRETTDVGSHPNYGKFDICFDRFKHIDGAYLQHEDGKPLSQHESRLIDKLALLEVPKYAQHRSSGSAIPRRLSDVPESAGDRTQSRRASLNTRRS